LIVPGGKETLGASTIGLVSARTLGGRPLEVGYIEAMIPCNSEENEARIVIVTRAVARDNLLAFLALRPGNGILTG